VALPPKKKKSEAIPPVIFVIFLRAGVAVEVMCRENWCEAEPGPGASGRELW